MKIVILSLFCLYFLTFCNKNRQFSYLPQEVKDEDVQVETHYLDLSNQGLTEFPDLTSYKGVISVDLSNNKLNYLSDENIPASLKSLDLSNNQFKGTWSIHNFSLTNLNLSGNKISKLNSSTSQIDSINLTNNDIYTLTIDPSTRYLNLSGNSKLICEATSHFKKLNLEEIVLTNTPCDTLVFNPLGPVPYPN